MHLMVACPDPENYSCKVRGIFKVCQEGEGVQGIGNFTIFKKFELFPGGGIHALIKRCWIKYSTSWCTDTSHTYEFIQSEQA